MDKKESYNLDKIPCELCKRVTPLVTIHHLIPRGTHSKRVKRKYGDECTTRKVLLCVACHRQVHYLFSNKELENELNSLELLRVNPDIQKYLKWIRNKDPNFLPSKGIRREMKTDRITIIYT